jgi:16S rRNA (adenine1518-N6/adenine1519-N6)-dimethyltransferase
VSRFGRPAKKSLGQNFLVSEPVARTIVGAAAPAPGELVYEIGPGRGALTVPLAESGADVVAYEIDAELALLLGEMLRGKRNVEVVTADIREIDFDGEAAGRGKKQYKIIGNIPYHLTSTIMLDLPRWAGLTKAVLMVQKEVGERITASPGERNCGIVTVYLGSYFEIKKVARVRPGSFSPRPKVESVVLEIDPGDAMDAPLDRGAFLSFLKLSFSQRRKKLRSIFRGIVRDASGGAGTRPDEFFGVNLDRRPEELGLADWFELFDRYRALQADS